jgi:hypothetical protein
MILQKNGIVFVAWVVTEKLPADFVSEFNSVLKYGVDNIVKAVDEDYHVKSLSKEQTVFYLTKRIDYSLDEGKKAALKLFLSYIRQL